jgi:hypothetical protein
MTTFIRLRWPVVVVVFLLTGWLVATGAADTWHGVSNDRAAALWVGTDPPTNNMMCCSAPTKYGCYTPCVAQINCIEGTITKGVCSRQGPGYPTNDNATCVTALPDYNCTTPALQKDIEVQKCVATGRSDTCPYGGSLPYCLVTRTDPPGTNEFVTILTCNANESNCGGSLGGNCR